MKKFEIEWRGKIYDCEWSDDTNFEDLMDVKRVTSASGFIFDDNSRLCIIKSSSGDWTIPGGHVE
ncbi:MAG TPA: hypothetical protein VMC07_00925, partial [Candidatus Omnitrophota bacterium]|nr:hypothetical protein [Candidatus Omnitrophota bacterium]